MPPSAERAFARILRNAVFPRLAAVLCAAACCAPAARAGAWLPAAGAGVVEPMLRYAFASEIFPAGSFSAATAPGTREHGTQIRIAGEHGLGAGLSVDYDLRYGFLYRWKAQKGGARVDTDEGAQDQRIGIDYALAQDEDFADGIGLAIVIPGSSAAEIPALDSGHWAMEPIWRVGFKPGFWHLAGNLDLGSRVFMDGGAAQFRTHVELAAPVSSRLNLAAKLFFVRSARLGSYGDRRDRGELYNLLRAGIEARYRMNDRLAPFVAYEAGIAGMGGHASQRFTLGVKLEY